MVTRAHEPTGKDNTDKRYLPRWQTNIHCLWQRDKDKQAQSGIIKNLGCGGTCLSSERGLILHDIVHLTINLPFEPSIRINGTVCWVSEQDHRKLAGIHFTNVNGTVQDTILQHMLEAEHIGLADFWFKDWK